MLATLHVILERSIRGRNTGVDAGFSSSIHPLLPIFLGDYSLSHSSNMVFKSRLPKPEVPSSDVFNYIFHYGRRNYPWSRVIYKVDHSNEELTLAELEEKSRRFASVLTMLFNVAPGDVVSIFAQDSVRFSHFTSYPSHLPANIKHRFYIRSLTWEHWPLVQWWHSFQCKELLATWM